MKVTTAPSCRVDIYMAGDIGQARQVCRQYCFESGFCVHIHEADYIYTGGEEAGFKVGLINYPRFPQSEPELMARARLLTIMLLDWLHQHSASIVGPTETVWLSRRPE